MSGFLSLIFLLNSGRDEIFFISFATRTNIFGTMNLSVSVPFDTDLTLMVLNGNLEECTLDYFSGNTRFIISGDNPLITLYISIANAWTFLSCTVKELSLLSTSLKDDWSSLYTILNALSWILFILLFNIRLRANERIHNSASFHCIHIR